MKRLFILFLFANLVAGEIQPEWHKEFPGVWKTRIGREQAVNLLSAAGSQPRTLALASLPDSWFPFAKEVRAVEHDGKIFLRFPLGAGEQLYGLGLQFKNVNRRGKVYYLHVDHYGGKDNGRTHAPVPFYVSSDGYGVLINSAEYLTFYMGSTLRLDSENKPPVRDRNTDKEWDASPLSDAVEVLVPADGVEVIVFGGEKPLDAVQRYNLYCGGGVLPPKWGLGFTYRTHTKFSADQVKSLVDEFEKNKFPLDFIGLEPGWQSMAYPCSYEWDEGRFPDPAAFVAEMLGRGIYLNLWMNPYVSPKATLYQKLLPYYASHTVWMGAVPDYSLGKARKILADFFQHEHIDLGVSGYKVDEVDGYDRWLWPDVAEFPSGLSAAQLRQTYGLLLQSTLDSLFRANNRRTFGLVRASNAGASHLPFVIYNDYYSHKDFITALCNASFSGILWTPEARSSRTSEEWLRRVQSVCFSPMAMINAWASGTLPWSFEDVYPAVQSVASLRMRLLPYLYSAFARYHFEGIPPFRAMPLVDGFLPEKSQNDFDKTDLRNDVTDQYLAGDCLLVAPLFEGDQSRTVLLPKGKWYDFYTGELAGESGSIEVVAQPDRIPLFVKDGGIIPMMPAALNTARTGLPLELRHYGHAPGTFLLYDDDGETFDFEGGEFSWTLIKVDVDENGRKSGTMTRRKEGAFNYGEISWRFMTKD